MLEGRRPYRCSQHKGQQLAPKLAAISLAPRGHYRLLRRDHEASSGTPRHRLQPAAAAGRQRPHAARRSATEQRGSRCCLSAAALAALGQDGLHLPRLRRLDADPWNWRPTKCAAFRNVRGRRLFGDVPCGMRKISRLSHPELASCRGVVVFVEEYLNRSYALLVRGQIELEAATEYNQTLSFFGCSSDCVGSSRHGSCCSLARRINETETPPATS